MKLFSTRQLVLTAVFAALTAVATLAIQIPTPSTNGYFNVGDGIILTASAVLGGLPAMLAGGIGSALADVITGYSHWAIPTLIIKSAEGLIAGLIFSLIRKQIKGKALAAVLGILAMSLSTLFMVAGYFFASWAMQGYGYAVLSVVPNLIQAAAGVALAALLIYAADIERLINFIERKLQEPAASKAPDNPPDSPDSSQDNRADNTTDNPQGNSGDRI